MTDSALTNHGVAQIECLARYFDGRGVTFTRVFSSPLQRARVTANSLRTRAHASNLVDGREDTCQPTVVSDLREKGFGSFEGKPFFRSQSAAGGNRSGLAKAETRASLVARSARFFENYLVPLLSSDEADTEVIAVVAHGVILSYLFDTFLRFCRYRSPTLGPRTGSGSRPTWSNTGYLELDIFPAPLDPNPGAIPLGQDQLLRMTVLTHNGQEHLKGLKRTRGGVGSSKHDAKQRKLDSFFKASQQGRRQASNIL